MTQKTKLTAMLLSATMLTACDLRDRMTEVSNLPAPAQELLRKEFAGKSISFVKAERDGFSLDYDVVFDDGTAVEFGPRGEWQEVNCRQGDVPAGMVPQEIMKFVGERYPSVGIRRLERHRRGMEVKLTNGLEIEFDKQFRVRDIDD